METTPPQTTTQRILVAFVWLGACFALMCVDYQRILARDFMAQPLASTLVTAFCLLPIAGAVGALKGRGLAWLKTAALIWLLMFLLVGSFTAQIR